jgi:hypothetical protein
MKLIKPTSEQAAYGLRALKMVAEAPGEIHPSARKLIMAAQQHLAGTSIPLDDLEPIAPDELAAHIVDPALRLQLVEGMTAVSLVSDFPPQSQVNAIRSFADGFGIESELLETVQKAVDGHMLAFRMCYLRRTHFKDFVKTQLTHRGAIGTAKALANFAGLVEDKALSAKYESLKNLPPGTLGRELHDYYVHNGFGWPGQKHGFPEAGVSHDVSHLLSGYDTSAVGETLVAAFVAGYRQDPNAFFVALFGMIIFSTGYQLPPGHIATHGDSIGQPGVAPRLFRAIERGSLMTTDISVDFLVWPFVERPLDELRREWNVVPE